VKSEVELLLAECQDQDTDVKIEGLAGGQSLEEQRVKMKRRCDIIVACPGRLIDMLNQQYTNLRRATFIVLDEADELLDSGFEQQLRLIMGQVREDRQVSLFTATWKEDITKLVEDICIVRPVRVQCGRPLSACKGIQQCFTYVPDVDKATEFGQKLSALRTVVERLREFLERGYKGLVFCNKESSIREVLDALQEIGIACEGFSSVYTQEKRTQTLARFKDGELSLLVCTQLLGRGLDFKDLKYVVNFDMPSRVVTYVHQIGRTGRAGGQGFSMTLLTDEELLRRNRDLIDCLKESGRELDIPKWFYWPKRPEWRNRVRARIYPDENHHLALEDTARPAFDWQRPWNGRGSGQRIKFLQACNGSGQRASGYGAARNWMQETARGRGTSQPRLGASLQWPVP
jgi:ATP-dependent RNA helicase DDX5/DBP2